MRKICISKEDENKKEADKLKELVGEYNEIFEQNHDLNDEGVYFVFIKTFGGDFLNIIMIGADFVYKNSIENLDKFHYRLRDLIKLINELSENNNIFLYDVTVQ